MRMGFIALIEGARASRACFGAFGVNVTPNGHLVLFLVA